MVQVINVSKSFNGTPVVDAVSFKLEPSQVVGIVGPSGSGKSVLLKIIGGVLRPDTGEVIFGAAAKQRSTVGFLFQEGGLFDSMSVVENVAFPLMHGSSAGVARKEALERAAAVLGKVGLSDALYKLPGQLSGGMYRRAGIARALVAEPELVLLDDPTGGLDPVAASVIMNLVRKLHADSRPTVIIVSHDIRRLVPNTERIIAMFHGKIVTDASAERLIDEADPQVIRFLSMRYSFSAKRAGADREVQQKNGMRAETPH